ncbi:hypothetical protein BR1R3_10240 [Pseudomonas atacamensis]|nr:hypothetical protein BR1R3_10240 [Pseudomonas atacamensis]
MRQRVDAFGQRDDIQVGSVNVCRDEFDVVDPWHALRLFCVAPHRANFAAAFKQCSNQMPTDKARGASDQNFHSTFNSGTAMTKRPSH